MRTTLSSGTEVAIVKGSNDVGLVIIPDIWGLRELFDDLCSSLSERTGWSVACIEPFPGRELPGADAPDGLAVRGEALQSVTDTALLGDAMEAADLTEASVVNIIGFCMGGMYALKAASTGRFARAASFYGMAHVQESWRGEDHGDPVEMLSGNGEVPVMEIVGTEDPFVPEEHISDLESVGVVVHRYEGAGHGFVHDPSRPAYRADDAADAWEKVLSFLAG